MVNHRSFVKSFGHATEGVKHALEHNQNVRIHFLVGTAIILVSFFLGVSASEFGILMVLILLVISSEMINSALEEMTNLITQEHRQEAKVAKDVSAGMVLVISIGAAIVGAVILLPRVFLLFQ